MKLQHRQLAAISVVGGVTIPHAVVAAAIGEPILLVVGAVALAIAAVAFAVDRWWGVAPVLLGGLAMGGSIAGAASTMPHFDSVLDFFPVAGMVVGIFGGVAFSVSDLVARRRPDAWTGSRVGTSALVAGLAVFAALTVASGVATVTRETATVSAEERAGAEVLVYDGVKVRTNNLRAEVGETLRIVVENRDPIVHDFVIDGGNVDIDLGPKDEKLVEVTFDEPGEYRFRCTLPGHSGMSGTIVVEEARDK